MTSTDTHVYFWRGPFSNWHPCTVYDKPRMIPFKNSEQAFMYMKSDFFADDSICAEIRLTDDPQVAKKLGRAIRGFDAVTWALVAPSFMTYVNWLKYSQNESLKAELLSTGTRILVEASPYDAVWGIGISEEDAVAGREWRGTNLLGESLMKVRSLLK